MLAANSFSEKDPESPKRTKRNFIEFKERLKHEREKKNANLGHKLPSIETQRLLQISKLIEPSGYNAAQESMNTDRPDAHQWLTIMDRFANSIENIRLDLGDKRIPPELCEDVKVALIDDGVELTHHNLTGRIYGGWSCDAGYSEFQGIRRPYGNSTTQHGTLMASMICRVCPNAKIFVFRLDVHPGQGTRSHFTAKSAAEVQQAHAHSVPTCL